MGNTGAGGRGALVWRRIREESGWTVVTLTATDASSNTATCTATVTVEDNILPTAVCQDITVQIDSSCSVSITGADIDNGQMCPFCNRQTDKQLLLDGRKE